MPSLISQDAKKIYKLMEVPIIQKAIKLLKQLEKSSTVVPKFKCEAHKYYCLGIWCPKSG